MRHHRKTSRFGRDAAHRAAMFRNLVTSLFVEERILTTLAKARELRRVAEKLITLGKRGDLAARRLAASRLRTTLKKTEDRQVNDQEALRKLFEELGPRFKERPGGYTRIIKTGNRLGDCAPMAFIELLPDEKKPAPAKGEKGEGPAKGAAKSRNKAKIAKATRAAAKPAAKKDAATARKPKTSRKAEGKGKAKGKGEDDAEE